MTILRAVPDATVEQVILPPARDLGDSFKVYRALPAVHRMMVGPFIFLDHFGPMEFRAGAAPNVRPHPHIGLSTLTYLLEGEMLHRDSAGNVETIRAGDANWMTAGSDIVHSKRSPAEVQARGGSMFGQQIRVALPRNLEEVQPGFSGHGGLTMPRLEDDGAVITVIAGEAFGRRSPVPVHSDLMYVEVALKPGARLLVPAEHIERALFVVAGKIEVDGQNGIFGQAQLVVFKPGAEIVVHARTGAHLMLVGGEPFGEPRHIYWNFVSSSMDRIEQAKDDWRRGHFPKIAGETEFIPLPPAPPRTAHGDATVPSPHKE
jgi:redox-sensitive bicupin YhaK (pirin superfamily)